jgi:tRNA A37 N6-isopentenylltransferase MiaA
MADRHLLPLDYNFVCVSMWCDRVQSFRRIDRRVEQMVCDGLLVEVLRLYGNGSLRPSSMAARAIGYRHALCFLAEHQRALLDDNWLQEFDCAMEGEQRREKSRRAANAAIHDALMRFVERMQAATRQYSTRQLTWFKGDKRWLWFDTRPVDCKIDVDACADRLCSALEFDPPEKSPHLSPTVPPLSKVEVILQL